MLPETGSKIRLKIDKGDITRLQRMAAASQFVASSLGWKASMAEWAKAEMVDEPKAVFANIFPVSPTE